MNGCRPNAENMHRRYMISEIGCLACKITMQIWTPCTWHHIDGQKNQEKHKLTIGLCAKHHTDGQYGTALHQGKKGFEANIGYTERELLTYQNELIESWEKKNG